MTLYLNLILLYLFVALIVYLPKQDKVTKVWAQLFGLAQIIMAIQAAAGLLTKSLSDDTGYIFSAVNNLFFLGAALILLDKELDRKDRSSIWRYFLGQPSFLAILMVTLLAISMEVAALAAGQDIQQPSLLTGTAKTLIAFVSILVYLVEGVAYYSVLEFFCYRRMRYLPLLIAFSFSVIEIFALLITPKVLPEDNSSILRTPTTVLRFLYFLSPIMVRMLAMPEAPEINEVFENAMSKRDFILENGSGLVRAIGRSIAAQKVLLLVKMPNFSPDGPGPIEMWFTCYGWQDKQQIDDDWASDFSAEERKKLLEVCRSDAPVSCKRKNGPETIILPIMMYGGVIGVLFVRLHKGMRARAIYAEKLKLPIRAILPLVQSSRQMTAIKMLSDRFTENLIEGINRDEPESDKTKKPESCEMKRLTDGVDKILDSIQEILSPLAIAFQPSLQFNSERKVFWPNKEEEFPASKRPAFAEKYFGARDDDRSLEGIKPFPLEVDFGRMIMFVREGRDSLNRPTIGTHSNIRSVLARMIDNALKAIIPRNLDRMLADAEKEIRKMEGQMDGNVTAKVLQKAAEPFGISWVVIGLDQGRYFGDTEKVAAVREHVNFSGRGLHLDEITLEDGRILPLIKFSNARGADTSPVNFCFGVDEPALLLEDGTWRDIFSQFIHQCTNMINDVVIKEMALMIEARNAEIEKDKAVRALVHLQAILTHQFGTRIKGLELAIKRLDFDVKVSKLEMPEEIEHDMEWLKASINQLLSLNAAMYSDARTRMYKMEFDRKNVRPCDLYGAISTALEEEKLHLDHLKITTQFEPSDRQREMLVDAPYYAVYLSVANLLSNSRKALGQLNGQAREKKIEITAGVKEKHVICRVTDNGLGIERPDKLYDLNSGYGLHLTRELLQDNNCTIELIETGPAGTTFELRFPDIAHNARPPGNRPPSPQDHDKGASRPRGIPDRPTR
jgi:signal transduction histidine kinase